LRDSWHAAFAALIKLANSGSEYSVSLNFCRNSARFGVLGFPFDKPSER